MVELLGLVPLHHQQSSSHGLQTQLSLMVESAVMSVEQNIRKHQTTCMISSLDENGSLLAGQDCIAVASVKSLGRLCVLKV